MTSPASLAPILVVDDDSAHVFILQRRFASAGIHNPVQHAPDGLAAVAILEHYLAEPAADVLRPCVMFVDLKMPRMDGFELLAWVRERAVGECTVVVVLSTSDEPRDVQRAFDLGAHSFLTKYPSPEQLAGIVTRAMRRRAGEPIAPTELPSANPWGIVCAKAAERAKRSV